MIHLTYANRTEELLEALVAAVRSERQARGPFAPLELVVPNRSVETYLKFGLAQALGIAANLQVTFLRRMLARLAEQAVPGGRLVDTAEVEGHLLALLHDEGLLARPELGPVRAYIGAAGAAADAVDRRRFQLAARLAQLYDEYAASRPEMLRAWRERTTLEAHPTLAPLERWQRALWLELFASGGLVARWAAQAGHTPLALADLVRALERGAEVPEGEPPAPVHVFGVSYIARGYHAALGALARRSEVHVYTLNPCREFWEDLETAGELRRRAKRQGREALFPARGEAGRPSLALGDDPYGLLDERENLALRLWGRPGRENVRLLNQQGGGDFTGRFAAHRERGGARTVLERLQDDILDRVVTEAGAAGGDADDSLRVLPCPGIRRELEVIAGEIWRLCEQDPGLRLNEIAVVVPEAVKDRYLCHVPAVFAEAHELPTSIIDLPLGSGPRLADAAVALLQLPLGGFTRRELLPLLTHPAVLGRFPEASAAEWLRLCEELGIVHGADRQDHAGTYIERDVLNWDQGIRRLVLGVLMDSGGPAGEPPVSMGGQLYQPLPRAGDEAQDALAFGLLARSLIADARLLAGLHGAGPRQRPLAQWLELIRGLLGSYLTPADGEEEALLARCLSEIDALDDLPLGTTPVSYRIAAELAGRALSTLGGRSGQYLAHGVTVTSFVPMRAIPFRVVFVAGLGQGNFPRPGRGAELDLRAARRQPGDVSPREQDLYMFLETLLSARERLILSYVARDELTGAPLLPSPVLLELRDVLASGYLRPEALERLFQPAGGERPPLRRYDDVARLRPGSLAHREARAKALGASLRAALPEGAALPDLPALARSLPAERFEAVAARLEVNGPPLGRTAVTGGSALRVPLVAFRQFLEDPLQGSARFRLRMREVDGDEELLDRAEEPFATERQDRAALLREIMYRVMAGASGAGAPLPTWEAVAATLEALGQREELRGSGPTGFFAAAERPAFAAILRGWQEQVVIASGGKPLHGRVVRFGRAGVRDGLPGERQEAIALALPDGAGDIEIVGNTELLVVADDGPASLTFSCRSKYSNSAVRQQRETLRAFVDHLALSAAGLSAGAHSSLVAWAVPGESRLERRRFRPVDRARARSYLAALAGDMVTGARDSNGVHTGVHPYLLPCEAVFAARKRPLIEEIEKLRDAYLEKSFLTFSTVTGPVPEAVERHEPPPAEAAARMVEARFGLYFELLEEGR